MGERITLDRFMSLNEVKACVGFGHTAIYRKMKEGAFPKARSIGPRSVRWLESEIAEWIQNRPLASAASQ